MGELAHKESEVASVVEELSDGKKIVLRRSVEHPGNPFVSSPLKSFSVKKNRPSASPGSIRFFADVAQMSSKLRHF